LFADRDYLRSPYFTEELPEGEYVSVAVVDSGCGMSPETLARIFDPFFTTKFLGRGLGLAAVQGIVRGHKATLKVRTEPGRGSTFEVLFPRSHASVAPAPPAAAPAPAASGTVLVVEDEEPIRRVAQHVLESNGFRVLLAVDGQQAVDQFREHAAAIDAVLLDLTMPKKNGLEVLVELRQLRPEVRVVRETRDALHDSLRLALSRRTATALWVSSQGRETSTRSPDERCVRRYCIDRLRQNRLEGTLHDSVI